MIIVALVLSLPLWIDPTTLRELRGATPTPTPTPTATSTAGSAAAEARA